MAHSFVISDCIPIQGPWQPVISFTVSQTFFLFADLTNFIDTDGDSVSKTNQAPNGRKRKSNKVLTLFPWDHLKYALCWVHPAGDLGSYEIQSGAEHRALAVPVPFLHSRRSLCALYIVLCFEPYVKCRFCLPYVIPPLAAFVYGGLLFALWS